MGTRGKAFLHWDNPGHAVDYAVDVPADGAYLLTIPGRNPSQPFRFHLTKGKHTLRLVNVQQSVNLDQLILHSPDVPVTTTK